MSKFWQKQYISKYTGAEIDAAVEKAGDLSKVEANPTLAGTEAALTGLEVGETKYKVEQPINVVANPTLAGTEADLTGLQVGETKYNVFVPDYFIIHCYSQDLSNFTINETLEELAAAIDAKKQLFLFLNDTVTFNCVAIGQYIMFQSLAIDEISGGTTVLGAAALRLRVQNNQLNITYLAQKFILTPVTP